MQSISIALCTFNGERFLDVQMRSLREQRGVAEIVVVDDGSTDGTLAILARHAAEDPRVRIHRNPLRLGVTRNFEHAIGLARSSWVALADQDDVWLPGKLEQMRARWDGVSGLMHHATRKFHGQVRGLLPSPAGERRKFFGSDVRRLFYRNSIVGHTVLIRSDLARQLMPFPQGVPHDWWLAVGAAVHGEVQYVDEYLVHYRIHENNAYHSSGSRFRRLRSEHEMRLRMLQALAGFSIVTDSVRDFARDYRKLLQLHSSAWALWRFYVKHARVFFGGVDAPPSRFTGLRKSFGATLGAMAQPAVTGASLHSLTITTVPARPLEKVG